MSLTVCTSSTSEMLGDLATFREYLGIITTTDDEKLESALRRATAAVEAYVRYPLRRQLYAETLAGYGSHTLMVSRTPIHAVLRVFSGTSTSDATEYTSTEYRIEDADAGTLSMVNDSSFAWTASESIGTAGRSWPVPGSETRPWLVEYSAGFVVNGTESTQWGSTSTGRDCPYDLELAVMEEAKTRKSSVLRDSSITERKMGDLSVTYTTKREEVSSLLCPAGRDLAAPWRRVI